MSNKSLMAMFGFILLGSLAVSANGLDGTSPAYGEPVVSTNPYVDCRIMKKQINFYQKLGIIQRGLVMKKEGNFYREVGRSERGRIEVRHVNFYQEIGRVERGRIEKSRLTSMKKRAV